MSPFANERILITGAGSGIGRSLAIRLSAEGAAIGGIDRSSESLARLGAELKGRPFASAVADVTDRAGLLDVVRHVELQLGPTDRVIACAGIGRATPADAFSSDEFDEIVRINLIGVAHTIASVLPGMIARKKGHIVGLSSLASFRGIPRMAAYCASKAGLNAFLDSIAVELMPHNIHVSTICPGFIRTPMVAALQQEFPNTMELEYAVGRILSAIERKRRFVAFPAKPTRILRLLRWMPPAWADRVMRRLTEKGLAQA